MRVHTSLESLRRLALLSLVSLVASPLLVACSASDGANEAPAEPVVAADPTTPAPPGASSEAGAGASTDAAPPPKNECKLPALQGTSVVVPTFEVYAPPQTAPPVMTGGTLKGEYKVDKATVFLPSASAGLVDPRNSQGGVEAWAVFSGTNYRIYLKAQFTIASVIGPQSQGADTASQGGFVASGPSLTLDHACDTAIAQEADYSFTDNGAGRATILIKTPSPYGDTYLQLDAAKN